MMMMMLLLLLLLLLMMIDDDDDDDDDDVGADIHRPIRTSVRILIWQDYKHGYTCTARTTSRTLARDIRIRSPLRPFDFGDTFDSHSTLHDAGMFRHNRTDTELHDDDTFPVVSSHIQIPKV